jgi:thioredoxin reductase
MNAPEPRDVVIVGGGPAGLSAALVLGRARRRVLVVDAERPANAVSRSIGGLLAFGGSPAALRRAGRRQLRELDNVEVVSGMVLDVEPREDGVSVAVARDEGVERVEARSVLFAQGLRYDPPRIPGLAPLWGKSVFHCVFCDGWEMAGRPIAMRAQGPNAARMGLLARGWSDDVVLCTDGDRSLSDEDRARLDAAGVRVREEPIARLESRRGRLTQIAFKGGPAESREALFVGPERTAPSKLHQRAGLELDENNLIPADEGGRTEVDRVYVAGDASQAVRSVAISIGNGARVGTAMVSDLIVGRLARPRVAVRA